jgi:hypothetical protein
MAQVEECLLCKCEALSSCPGLPPPKKKKKEKVIIVEIKTNLRLAE